MERAVCLVVRLSHHRTRLAVQTLVDWSAAGLVAPFFVVDVVGGAPQARLVVDGVTDAVPLRTWVAQNRVLVETATLQVLDGPGPELTLTEVDAALEGLQRGAADVLNVIVPTTRTAGVPEDAAFPTRTNLLLQPVEAVDPLSPTDEVDGADPASLARHAALGFATAAGLWRGCPLPLAAEDRGDRNLRVFRCYVRRLDAGDVLDGVAHSIFDPEEGGLPRPVDPQENEFLLPIDDVQSVADAEAAARGLADRHRDLIRFVAPAPFAASPYRQMSFGEALAEFTRALLAALRGAHRVLVNQVVDGVSEVIARKGTKFFYGNESDRVVVVRGIQPNGERAEDTVLALARAGQAVLAEESSAMRPQPVQAGQLWREAVATGTALADGGTGSADAVLPRHGSDRLVVTNPERVAPDPEAQAFAIPTGLLPQIGAVTVFPNDPHGAARALALLEDRQSAARAASEAGDPGAAAALDRIARMRTGLVSWVQERRGFAWGLGAIVATELDKARRALADLTRGDDPSQRELLDQVRQAQPRAERVLWTSLGTALLLVLLVVLAFLLTNIPAWVVAVSAAVAAVVWFLWSALAYIRVQRALFQLRHRRDELIRRREWEQTARHEVAGRLTELADLYRQAMQWTTVLGSCVHDPFGRQSAPSATPGEAVVGDVPLPLALGRAGYTDEHAATVHRARTRLLSPGWLGDLTRHRIEAALGPRARRTGDPRVADRVWDDAGLDARGPLAELVAQLRSARAGTAARAAAMRGLVRCLTELDVGADVLWPRVEATSGHAPSGTGADFLAPLHGVQPHLPDLGFTADGVTTMAYAVQRVRLVSRGPRTSEGSGSSPLSPDGQPGVPVTVEHVVPEPNAPDALDRWLVRADVGPASPVSAFACFQQPVGPLIATVPVVGPTGPPIGAES